MSEEMQLALEHTLKTMRELKEAKAEIERLRAENIQMKFALGYPMPADLERYVLPSNPFKCGTCDARAALAEEKKDD